jgi:hypothetical protein
MYSLTIHFGPNAMVWSFLFKEKEAAEKARVHTVEGGVLHEEDFMIEDDFGQKASFHKETVHGVLLEDLDLVEEARILRSLANARGEVKARQRATSDPVIRAGMQGGGPSVITPRFNG